MLFNEFLIGWVVPTILNLHSLILNWYENNCSVKVPNNRIWGRIIMEHFYCFEIYSTFVPYVIRIYIWIFFSSSAFKKTFQTIIIFSASMAPEENSNSLYHPSSNVIKVGLSRNNASSSTGFMIQRAFRTKRIVFNFLLPIEGG